MLRPPQDGDKLDRSGVYKLICSCGHFYIGKTLRSFHTRIHEHVRPLQLLQTRTNYNFNSNSSFAKHVLSSAHILDVFKPNVQILHFNNHPKDIDNLELLEILKAAKHKPQILLNDVIEFEASIFLKYFIEL